MSSYRYTLASNKVPKLNCPYCGAKKHWQRYIDTHTGEILPAEFGRCDNADKCGEENNPYKTGYAKQVWQQERGIGAGNWKSYKMLQNATPKPLPKIETAYIPKDVLQQTLQGYEQNVFLQNLLSRVPFPIDAKDVERVTALYYLGTVCKGYRAGAITFPFIDKAGNVRAVQVKQFDETNHTTSTDKLDKVILNGLKKESRPAPEWLTKYIESGEANRYYTCYFGEHLLSKFPLSPIALTEAPKNAIYGTLYFGFPEKEKPENLLWLAVYNLNSLTLEKCKALQGRDVYLFPDLSKGGKAFQLWSQKAKEFTERMPGTRFIVSDLLETLAPAKLREKGADIADVLTGLDWKRVRELWQKANGKPTQPEHEKHEKYEAPKNNFISAIEPMPASVQPVIEQKQLAPALPAQHYSKPEQPKPESWAQEITELETYFAGIALPQQPVKPNRYSTLTNVSLFLHSHFATVKGNNGKRTFLPYLNRLQELKHYLTFNT